jgi:hypothetical protein
MDFVKGRASRELGVEHYVRHSVAASSQLLAAVIAACLLDSLRALKAARTPPLVTFVMQCMNAFNAGACSLGPGLPACDKKHATNYFFLRVAWHIKLHKEELQVVLLYGKISLL